MTYAYQASSGVNRRPVGDEARPTFSSRIIKGTTFAVAGAVTTIILAVATLSATSVSTRTNDARRGGLADLMISAPVMSAASQRIKNVTGRSFKPRKFDRFKLQVDENVQSRFAYADDSAVGKNPLFKGFELAMVVQEAAEASAAMAASKPKVRSMLLAPVETAVIPDGLLTGSIPARNNEAQELAKADMQDSASPEAKESPFESVLNDVDIPLPAARPDYKAKVASTQLAYAAPDAGLDEVLPEVKRAPKLSQGIAVYDITAQKVYLPDGKIMEAHSGLGHMRDNPKYIKVKGRGPTPPNRYKLSMREKLFHGVPALRMTPSDWSKMHGRNGILAHTYLRRRPGDSAGCIAFKDYYKFLEYYKKGIVKEIIVVEKMSKRPTSLASLFGSK